MNRPLFIILPHGFHEPEKCPICIRTPQRTCANFDACGFASGIAHICSADRHAVLQHGQMDVAVGLYEKTDLAAMVHVAPSVHTWIFWHDLVFGIVVPHEIVPIIFQKANLVLAASVATSTIEAENGSSIEISGTSTAMIVTAIHGSRIDAEDEAYELEIEQIQ